MRLLLLASLIAVAALAVAARFMLPALYAEEFAGQSDQPPDAWATSDTCEACHQDQYASWYRTFHRTMTQEATPASVRGRFDGNVYRYWGVGVRPVQRGDEYFFEYLDGDGNVAANLQVLRTVGSHRYQQYLVQTPTGGETYYRVHLLWHMEDERWMHINGVFLRPDEQGFDDRVAVWNHNCIFCHNTGPRPRIQNFEEMGRRERAGQPIDSAMEAQYDSEVAELGIACETCHGPGGVHAARNRNPLRRYALQFSAAADPTITHPRKVSQQQSVDICGQCHGQRTPGGRHELMAWITDGPSFRAGARLTDHVNIVYRDMALPPGIEADQFRLRFWADGTARLTAYEYQGLNQSACFDGGEITCISCHTMHSGDVHGNISEENRSNAPCLKCHTDLAADLSAHTHHEPDSSGSQCYECHMPKMVFGLTDIHRSHRIENPRPEQNRADNRPDACTNCHTGASSAWAQQQTDALWKDTPAPPSDDGISNLVESLHGGDPVQRAVAARLAGRNDAPGSARERAWLIPHLLRAMEDHYPSTRNLSRKSLLALHRQLLAERFDTGLAPILLRYDFIGPVEQRGRLMSGLWQAWRDADKSGLPAPGAGTLVDARWEPVEPATSELIDIGHSNTNEIAIGE